MIDTGFGAPPAAPQPSLFGGASGGFGQPANNFGSGGLFGAKPAAPGGFGAPPAQPQPGGLFGAQPPAAQSNLFGGLGNSFGGGNPLGSTQQSQPQQLLYASVDDNAYGSNPLFANVGAQAAPVNPSDNKKKPPLSSTFRSTPRSSTKITRLRGFGTASASPGMNGTGLGMGSPMGFGSSIGAGSAGTPGSGRGSPLHLINGLGEEATLGPNAFVSRPSAKKLIIERRPGSDDLSRSRTPNSTLENAPPKSKDALSAGRTKVAFNPDLEISARDRQVAANQKDTDSFGSSTPVKRINTPVPQEKTAEETVDRNSSEPATRRSAVAKTPVHGDYYTKPSIETLRKLPASSLQSLSDLTVGRVGFGEVTFNAPVDLTTLNSVEDLCGGIVVFEERTCTVYPPDYEDKPPLGQGLNQPGTITLFRCFPLDKSTRQPITDKAHPKLISHIKRLRNLDGVDFIDFVVEEGTWIFGVPGF